MFFNQINATIQTKLQQYVDEWRFRDSYVIGVQLRFGSDGGSFIMDEEVWSAVNCAKELALVIS
jgi:hypothetical protein